MERELHSRPLESSDVIVFLPTPPLRTAGQQVDPLLAASADGRSLHVPWLVGCLGKQFLNNLANNFPIPKAGEMDEETQAKIRNLSQADIPIEKRRSLYNQLSRRMKNSNNLKPGLVEKYNAACSSRKDRFNLLKEFMIDENMSSPQHFNSTSETSSKNIMYRKFLQHLNPIFQERCASRSLLHSVGVLCLSVALHRNIIFVYILYNCFISVN